ncbi:hypothetical protein BC943DRAFT_360945 [Umbelopsis sp. AD052]|nr:hypothetical protein BC943DRAFT_360945 [Umbelopsis sp. AD052]
METLETSRQIINDVIPHIRYLLEYGRVLRSSGKSDDAVPYFKKANETAVGLEDFYAADAAHMLGILDPTAGPIKGRTWSEEALAVARKSTHPPSQRWAAIILNNTARMAVEHNKTQRTKESYRIARWSVAYTLRHANRLEDAYTIQKQLLSEGNTKSNREELGILAEKLGYTNEAEEHKKALEEMEAK